MMLNKMRDDVYKKKPLIHCITNPISITQCANAILAVGARPIMAEHPKEVAEITATADALMLNLGNITDVRMESMKISYNKALQLKIPVIIDAVGVACSKLRSNYMNELLEIGFPTVIKGNYSEIMALRKLDYRASGVDAEQSLEVEDVIEVAKELAIQYHTIILVSGKVDIVTDGKEVVLVHNGSAQLATITGTGCMLGALCACFISVKQEYQAALLACALLGISGELSETEEGSGSFFCNLMNHINTLKNCDLEEKLRMEVK